MTSDDDEAERSRHHASKSAGSRQQDSYDGAASCRQIDKESDLGQSLSRLQPMKFVEQRSDVVIPRRREHQRDSGVHHRLETLELVQRNTGDPAVTKRVTLPATGKRIWGRIGGCFVADAARRSRQRRSW